MSNNEPELDAAGRVNDLIIQALRQRLWSLAVLLIICYPVNVRIVRNAMTTPPDDREHSPFVYLMR